MGMISCEAYYYRIGSSIRRNRQEKGMTQEGLAEAAGLSLKMVQKLEGGQYGFCIRRKPAGKSTLTRTKKIYMHGINIRKKWYKG